MVWVHEIPQQIEDLSNAGNRKDRWRRTRHHRHRRPSSGNAEERPETRDAQAGGAEGEEGRERASDAQGRHDGPAERSKTCHSQEHAKPRQGGNRESRAEDDKDHGTHRQERSPKDRPQNDTCGCQS